MAPAGCYAFRRQGRVWVACGSKSQPVSKHSYWAQYAISPKGDYLLALGGPWALHGNPNPAGRDFVLVPLPRGPASLRPYPNNSLTMLPTCGTVEGPGKQWPVDLVTGAPLRFDDARGLVACSDDRRLAVALIDATPSLGPRSLPIRALYLVGGPKPVPFAANVGNFAVSPGGAFIAFGTTIVAETHLVCMVEDSSGKSFCSRSAPSPESVSDTGGLLGTEYPDTRGTSLCRFEGLVGVAKKAGPTPYAGAYDDLGPCPAVYYWVPAFANPALVQSMADEPQWITPETAHALIAGYAAHRWPEF